MASSTIANLTAASALSGSELFYATQGGADRKVTITQVNTLITGGGTLAIASGKTLTASNSLTFTGTDTTSFAFPSSSDTVVTLGATQTLTNKTLTSPALTTPTLGVATATSLDGGAIGAITPSTGAFTTLSASSTVSGTGFSTYLASPPAIGGSAPAAGTFTALAATSLSMSGAAAISFSATGSIIGGSIGNSTALTVQTSNQSGANNAAAMTVKGGSNTQASGTNNGGSVTITGGNASGAGSTGNGGNITLTPGTSVGGTAGTISLVTSVTGPDSVLWTGTGFASPTFTGTASAAAITASGIIRTSSAGSAANPSLAVGNATTGLYSVSTTGLGFSVNGTVEGDWGISASGAWTLAGNVNTASNFILTANAGRVEFRSGSTLIFSPATATFQLGNSDAASPVAQTLQVQSVAAGNANTAAVTWTHQGSLSNGSGAGGDMVFKTTLSTAASGSQNTAATALTIKGGTQQVTLANLLNLPPLTVSTLPSAPINGSVALVTDATSNVLIGAGGGSAYALVAYNGSAWVAV